MTSIVLVGLLVCGSEAKASGKVAAASAVAGATLATFVTLVATQGGCQTPTVTASVSVFCTAFKPIMKDDLEALDKLPLHTAERIVEHNATYRSLCVKRTVYDKVKDFFRGKPGK